jgi:hypothetical protein
LLISATVVAFLIWERVPSLFFICMNASCEVLVWLNVVELVDSSLNSREQNGCSQW